MFSLASLFQRSDSRRRSPRSTAARVVDLLESRVLLTAVNIADEEQLVLELINRARANPEAEATRLGITLNSGLPAGTITSTPKQPLVLNQQLQNASVGHTVDMINRDFFEHTNPSGVTPGGRATAAGYDWWTIAENIAYIGYFGTVDINGNSRQAHDLLFKSAGHRENILMDEAEEIGVGIRSGAFVPSGGNATLVTENFGRRDLDPIITGVVYSDNNDSNFYDIGEAVRSGTITARRVSDGAVFTDSIGVSGGYGLIVPAGSYVVTAAFNRNGAPVSMSSSVTVTADNVKVDFDATTAVAVNLALSSPSGSITETGSTSTMLFTVSRSGSTSGPYTVNLNSTDTTEVTVPASVVIPDGQSSATFTVTAVNDGLIDGTQTASVQASAVGATSASRSISINDTSSPSFAVNELVTTTLRPTFSWNGLSNAATYEILVAKIAPGSPVVLRQSGIASTSFAMPVDLPLGDYYIIVRGFSAGGAASRWSSSQVIRSRPGTTVEGSGRTETSATFTIRWASIPGALTYDVVVDRLTSQTSGFLRNTSVSGTSLTVNNFPIGQYQVRVRGQAGPGQFSGWSPAALITVSLRATGVQITADEFGTVATLNWNAVDGAVRYDVQIDNRTTGVNQVIRNGNVVGTSLSLPGLTPGVYSAYIRPIDAARRAYPSAVAYSFSFNSASRLTYAATSIVGRPLLSWIAVAGAARYELVFANASLVPQITLSNLTGNQYQPSTPLTTGSWRAWIRAFDSQGQVTANSNIVAFNVAFSPSEELLSSPLMLIDRTFHEPMDLLDFVPRFQPEQVAVMEPEPAREVEVVPASQDLDVEVVSESHSTAASPPQLS